MSRIKGIEAKVHKDLQSRRNCNEIIKKKNESQLSSSKDDVEKHQIEELLHKLPKLDKIFEVHRKIGEGTFSSVYLGSLRQDIALPNTQKKLFAIKHLVPTAHPARVEHELRCLQDMGGKHNVIGVELCLRQLDTIVFVMPYIPHKKFSEFVADMDANELRDYMRALLIALRHVHSFGVIHRDVKPSNFLYDRENRRYLLVDFGLAQRVCPPPPPAHAAHKRPRDGAECSSPAAKRIALDLSLGTKKTNCSVPIPAQVVFPRIRTNSPAPKSAVMAQANGCACAGAAGVCTGCAGRALPRAPRAGTQGFRPPEVLLKYPHQTTAVDMWACGVVLASVLTARYPLFRAADDVSALAELVDLLGTESLHRAARSLGRRLVMSTSRPGLCLRKLCRRLRGASDPPPAARNSGAPCINCRSPTSHCLCRDDTQSSAEPQASVAGFPDSAFALAMELLDPDPCTRPTAAAALQHPFLRAPS